MKNIAVFTSGGDAPGMNAAIRAVVRTGLYNGLKVFGIYRGYDGMINGDIKELNSQSVSNIIQSGGTILKSARSEEFRTKEGRQKAYTQLKKYNIDGVVAIGGDGTFTGAKVFSEEFDMPFIGVPGTIDNDIFGTDQTIGYDTAVNTALEAIDRIRDTADSHDRVFFIEVMGRDSGYIAVPCGIGGGAEMIIIPETKTNIDGLVELVKTGKKSKRKLESRTESKDDAIIKLLDGFRSDNAMPVVFHMCREGYQYQLRTNGGWSLKPDEQCLLGLQRHLDQSEFYFEYP